jgi:HEAT repeat protein
LGDPTRFCPSCYAPNAWSDERCARCGAALVTDETYDERLIWALGHPDTAAAMLAAKLLAARRSTRAVPVLIALLDSPDPFRAAAAAEALAAFRDDARVKPVLERLQHHPSALVRRAARRG